jgi:RNA polymerase sigma-70 factor (ECF subfamily)
VIKARGGGQARRRETPLAEENENDLPPSNIVLFDPNRRIAGREVLETAAQLPDEQRAVLWLIVVEEFSYREAAEILGVPVGTVMSRLHRARRELRKRLASSPLNRRAQGRR